MHSRLCLCAVPLDGFGAWQGRLKNWWRRAAAETPPRAEHRLKLNLFICRSNSIVIPRAG